MPQSRYLFAMSCFHLDLLSEAEAALCPANESGAEVQNHSSIMYFKLMILPLLLIY